MYQRSPFQNKVKRFAFNSLFPKNFFLKKQNETYTQPREENPCRVKLYNNRSDVTGFDAINRAEATDTIILADTSTQEDIIYSVNSVKFMNCSSISMFFDQNFGGDETHVRKIIFFGECSKQAVNPGVATNVVYESRGNPDDHPMPEDELKKGRAGQGY